MGVCKVKKNGRVMWRARRDVNGKPKTAFRRTKAEAEEEDRKFALMQKGELVDEQPEVEVSQGVPTLAEFLPRFMEYQATENRTSELRTKEQVFREHITPVFGALNLDQITPELVDGYKAAKLKELAPQTVANHVTHLKRLLHQARDWNILEKPPRIKQVKTPDSEFDFLGRDEVRQFILHSGAWMPFVVTAIRTGLRLGELRGLQWGAVDLEQARVRVSKAYTKDGWGPPKSGHGRTVDLSWDALEVLRELKPERVNRNTLVFPSPSGQPLDEKAVYRACNDIAAKAGITKWVVMSGKSRKAKQLLGPFDSRLDATKARKELGRGVVRPTRPMGPHKLRHTFASLHAMAGTPLPVIQQWMGHAEITTTMRYAHLCPSTTATYANNGSPNNGPRLVPSPVPDAERAGTKPGTKEGVNSQNVV